MCQLGAVEVRSLHLRRGRHDFGDVGALVTGEGHGPRFPQVGGGEGGRLVVRVAIVNDVRHKLSGLLHTGRIAARPILQAQLFVQVQGGWSALIVYDAVAVVIYAVHGPVVDGRQLLVDFKALVGDAQVILEVRYENVRRRARGGRVAQIVLERRDDDRIAQYAEGQIRPVVPLKVIGLIFRGTVRLRILDAVQTAARDRIRGPRARQGQRIRVVVRDLPHLAPSDAGVDVNHVAVVVMNTPVFVGVLQFVGVRNGGDASGVHHQVGDAGLGHERPVGPVERGRHEVADVIRSRVPSLLEHAAYGLVGDDILGNAKTGHIRHNAEGVAGLRRVRRPVGPRDVGAVITAVVEVQLIAHVVGNLDVPPPGFAGTNVHERIRPATRGPVTPAGGACIRIHSVLTRHRVKRRQKNLPPERAR